VELVLHLQQPVVSSSVSLKTGMPVAQVRGPLEVLRVDRRLLVTTDVGELLVELAQA
jgi:hypothetical protein